MDAPTVIRDRLDGMRSIENANKTKMLAREMARTIVASTSKESIFEVRPPKTVRLILLPSMNAPNMTPNPITILLLLMLDTPQP
jgi:hypothetical protein